MKGIRLLMVFIKKSIKRLKGTFLFNMLIKFIEEDIDKMVFTKKAQFTDKYGNTIDLLNNFRDYIKPNWQSMLDSTMQYYEPPLKEVDSIIFDTRHSIEFLMKILEIYSFNLVGKRVLEIGCWNGARSYALAEKAPLEVIASDMPDYYLKQCNNSLLSDNANYRQSEYLNKLRLLFRERMFCEVKFDNVNFIDDDICSSSLPSESFDLVCSWEVLEHIQKPEDFFQQLNRLLKVGGISFHEYNPFFAIDGGHSLCTLDFPWGHTRLDSDDFKRYVIKFRPSEAEVDISFYDYNLNRMTLADLHKYIIASGLEILALIPRPEVKDLYKMKGDYLVQAINNYPTITLTDFISRKALVIIRKPKRK
jgi:2-polyprenyl-3-methyl-5-hydroxy-6-metoxy-1,4-benzoquinol methylase